MTEPNHWPADQIRGALIDQILAPIAAVAPTELADLTSINELGLGSLDYVQVTQQIKRTFGIAFGPADLFGHREINDLVALIAARLAESSAGHRVYFDSRVQLPVAAELPRPAQRTPAHSGRGWRRGRRTGLTICSDGRILLAFARPGLDA